MKYNKIQFTREGYQEIENDRVVRMLNGAGEDITQTLELIPMESSVIEEDCRPPFITPEKPVIEDLKEKIAMYQEQLAALEAMSKE